MNNSGEDQGGGIEQSIEKAKSDFDYYILFLDPESRIYYRKIIGRDDFIRLETMEPPFNPEEGNNHKDLNYSSQQKFKEQKNDKKSLKNKFFQRNTKFLVELTKLLLLNNFSWTFSGEADSYRRRPFPMKFLQYECSDYPTYVFSSELSKAFDDINEIDTEVDLKEFAYKIKEMDSDRTTLLNEIDKNPDQYQTYKILKEKEDRDGKKQIKTLDYKYKSKQSLVTSTEEFIKNIKRYVYKTYNRVKIEAEKNHILTLKVDGFREYLAGNCQLLQFERVRLCLRKNLPLKLILTQIDLDRRDMYFPPLFKMKKEITYPIIHVKNYKYKKHLEKLDEWNEKQKKLETQKQNKNSLINNKILNDKKQIGIIQDQKKGQQNKIFQDEPAPKDYIVTQEEQEIVLGQNKYDKKIDSIDFEKLIKSSAYFWYPPIPELEQEAAYLVKKSQQKSQGGGSQIGDKRLININNGLSQRDKDMMNWVEVPTEKKQISITKQRYETKGTTRTKNREQLVVESGESNYKFRFKIISLERIYKIFEEIQHPVATDNLETEPRNVTLHPLKKKDKQQKPQKNPKQKENTEKNNLPESGNEINRESDAADKLRTSSNLITQQTEITNIKPKQKKSTEKGAQQDQNENSNQIKILSKAQKLYRSKQFDQEDQKKSEKQDQKIKEIFQPKNFKKIEKKKIKIDQQLFDAYKSYMIQQFLQIQSPFCNSADQYQTLEAYKNILRIAIGAYTPYKLKLVLDLYHGCEKLVEHTVTQQVYFGNNVYFNKWVNFGNLKYCQLPIKTRLSINIVLVFQEEGYELIIACVSMNLFDEKKRFKSGVQDLSVWPFYQIDERLGCMKEYKGKVHDKNTIQMNSNEIQTMIDNQFCKLILEFEEFIYPMYYSSRDLEQLKAWGLTLNEDDKNDETSMFGSNIQKINSELAKLKTIFAKNPISHLSIDEKEVLFRTREHYQSLPQGLPMFLRSVKWNKPLLVHETYKMLKNWALMEPEDAIALLDAKFPDEKVRQYAVSRINQLSDDLIALYMLQFAQALLYEEQHFSPLSDMLIERSLKNPYVVGQQFFWALKGNLYLKTSYERYYLILESFLLLCGKFRQELQSQVSVNLALTQVQINVILNRYGKVEKKERLWLPSDLKHFVSGGSGSHDESDDESHDEKSIEKKEKHKSHGEQIVEKKEEKKKKEKIDFEDVKKMARQDLLKERQKMPFLFNLAIDPKTIIRDFDYQNVQIMKSKKVPTVVVTLNAQKGGLVQSCMFKNGDDLRQDILTLQLISIIDRIWLNSNLDMKLTPYRVMGTDCMQGYIEFVTDSETLGLFQRRLRPWKKSDGIPEPKYYFAAWNRQDTISNYFELAVKRRFKEQGLDDDENSVQQELAKIRKTFSKSCAGYCVISYILGLGDRHCDNIMINVIEGNFLHIDFGHFLGNYKSFKGIIQRETDPFVFTPEIAHFVNGGPLEINFVEKVFGKNKKTTKNFDSSSKNFQSPLNKKTDDHRDHLGSNRNTIVSKNSYKNSSPANDFSQQSSPTKDFQDDLESGDENDYDPSNQEYEAQNEADQEIDYEKLLYNFKKVQILNKSKQFEEFEEDCCTAYNIIRKEGNILINLFLLMLSAGMPELNKEKDIEFLVERLHFDLTEQEASKLFKKEIIKAMNNRMRRFDNVAHNIKQLK